RVGAARAAVAGLGRDERGGGGHPAPLVGDPDARDGARSIQQEAHRAVLSAAFEGVDCAHVRALAEAGDQLVALHLVAVLAVEREEVPGTTAPVPGGDALAGDDLTAVGHG